MSAAKTSSAGTFEGFAPDALRFFDELSENQNKEWMAAHKARYEASIRDPLAALVVALSARFAGHGIALRGDPKTSLFRINRDVRFSPDKRPYNDHASAALTRDGDKQSPGVFYIQLAPHDSFAAAGFFRAEPAVLHRLRQGMAADPKGWTKLTAGLARHDLTLQRDDTLVRPPKGFEDAPAEVGEDLKLKSWIVMRKIASAELASPALVDALGAFAQHARPLLDFGWHALVRFPAPN